MCIIKSFMTSGASELADCKNYGNVCQLSIRYKIRQTAEKELQRILHPPLDPPWRLFHKFASVIQHILLCNSTHLLCNSTHQAAVWWWCTATSISREQQRQHCFTPHHLCLTGILKTLAKFDKKRILFFPLKFSSVLKRKCHGSRQRHVSVLLYLHNCVTLL